MGGRIIVFLLVSFAWVPFYAGDPERTFDLYGRMFVGDVPSLESLWLDGFGMRWEVWIICGIGVLFMLAVSLLQERYKYTWFDRMGRHGVVIFICGIVCYTVLLLVGVYGADYDPTPFIYGGF